MTGTLSKRYKSRIFSPPSDSRNRIVRRIREAKRGDPTAKRVILSRIAATELYALLRGFAEFRNEYPPPELSLGLNDAHFYGMQIYVKNNVENFVRTAE